SLSGLAGNSQWYRSSVQVTLIAVDPDDAVAATVYTVDGGAPVMYSAPFTISGDGLHSLSFFSTDHAGNREVGHVLAVKIDTTPPGITGTRTPGPNGSGWNNTSVT